VRRLAVALVLAPSIARTDSSVVVTLNAQGQQLANQYGQSEPQLIAQAQQGIEDIYQTQHLADLLRAFANTGAFSDRGLGADYQSDPDTWMIGIGATGALASDVSLGSSQHVVYGAVVNIGGIVGTSLARWGAPRWSAFVSGSYEDTTIRALKGTLESVGAHAQTKLIAGGEPGALRWTGLDLTGGVEVAHWEVGQAAPINVNFKVHGTTADQVTNVRLDSTGTLTVSSSTYTIPIELTTGVRLGGLFALYGGGGLDLTLGTASIVAQLNGTMSMNADHIPIGTVVITGSGSNSPDALSAHALAGLELHTRHFRVFAQGTIAPADEAVTFGLRAVP
jgi:hypothetical protein